MNAPKTKLRQNLEPQMAVIGYARTSTTKQDLATQKKLLREAGADVVKTEQKSAGKKRPVFDEVVEETIQRAMKGEDIEVVVTRLDRFGRSVHDVVGTLERFQAACVRFRSLADAGVTLDRSPQSKLLISMLAAVASFERELARERTLETKKARNAWGGRPKALSEKQLAYARSKREVDEWSMRRISDELGVSTRTLQRHLAA